MKKMTELELKLTRALMDMVRQYCAATPDLDDLVTADFNCMSCDENAINLLCDIGLATPQDKRSTGFIENPFLDEVHKLETKKLDEMEAVGRLLYEAKSVIEGCVFAEVAEVKFSGLYSIFDGEHRGQLMRCNHKDNGSLYTDSCNAEDCPIKECIK